VKSPVTAAVSRLLSAGGAAADFPCAKTAWMKISGASPATVLPGTARIAELKTDSVTSKHRKPSQGTHLETSLSSNNACSWQHFPIAIVRERTLKMFGTEHFFPSIFKKNRFSCSLPKTSKYLNAKTLQKLICGLYELI
jgi:hypothetical protein